MRWIGEPALQALFIEEIEKGAVLFHGTADSAAEEVADQTVPRLPLQIVEEAVGVERTVAVFVEEASVEGIAARARDGPDLARAAPQLGIGGRCHDAKFLDTVHADAGGHIWVVEPIDQVVLNVIAIDGYVEAPGTRATKVLAAVGAADTRLRAQKIERIAPRDPQVQHSAFVDYRADRRSRVSDLLRSGGAHLHGVGGGADFQIEVERDLRAHFEIEIAEHILLKALMLGGNLIDPRIQGCEDVDAGFIRERGGDDLVTTWRASTRAAGTTAPDGSVTVPDTPALVFWLNAGPVTRNTQSRAPSLNEQTILCGHPKVLYELPLCYRAQMKIGLRMDKHWAQRCKGGLPRTKRHS
jgi:hypothetical protein